MSPDTPQTPPAPTPSGAPPRADESLIDYPCAFPIKVMGLHQEAFIEAVVAIAQTHDPAFQPHTLERRPSSSGTYLGLTVTVMATSRDQLDALYRALTSHPLVKYVL
ncbi:DUF493 family protein [Aquabacterium fontiphilum]|uniref:HP0495 family protein n=1 Tax=Aquabacterium fontiphilum TaxID=450365 RepID=UPI001377A19E|nr:DUF493 domain-containing protein [Aquabacterium fontiphilum]NBD21131.1 DUF493 family protein [Aquabacterium fontiphilum]